MCVTYVSLHHRHAIHSQRSSFIRADGSGITHGLTGIQVPHQVVVFHHFLSRKDS